MSDKSWENEPDSVDFWDEKTGYPIAIRRHPQMRHLCGYIGIPDEHPWNGKKYSDSVEAPPRTMEREVNFDEMGVINLVLGAHTCEPDKNQYPIDILVRCHGGLTYSGSGNQFGDDRASWWFGFDCSHAGDLTPGLREHRLDMGMPSVFDDEKCRDFEYVKEAARKAAGDLALAQAKEPFDA